jgi:hypothetical protein
MSTLVRHMPRSHAVPAGGTALSTAQRACLASGPLASALYVVWNDVFAAARWDGYSGKTQAISELSSVGAPSRDVLIPWFNLTYSALMVAFGIGVWRSAQGKPHLRATGALIAAYGASGPLWLPFPMTMRDEIVPGASMATTDVMHIVLSALSLILWLSMVLVAAKAFGRPIRVYSIATAVLIVGFGAMTGQQSGHIAAGEATPWLGVVERAMFGAFLLWVVVLAAALWRRAGPSGG